LSKMRPFSYTKKLKFKVEPNKGDVVKLSEVKGRFRIKNGEIEIEYEGPIKEVNQRFEKVLGWIMPRKEKMPEAGVTEEKEKKKSKRGGRRKPIYPPVIKRLMKEGFFKQKKSLDEVIKKLETMNVPTRGKRATIRNALVREAGKKGSTLKATKEDDTWYFMQD